MQLTKFSDYALRILMHLAAGDQQRSAREIAQAQGLSFNHLAKISQWLAAEGYVEATRGRGGGMRLAMVSDQINVGTLLRKSEAGSPLVECLGEGGGCCALTPACGLLPYLAEAQEAFFQTLDKRSLADVMSRKSGLAKLIDDITISPATQIRL